MYFDKAIIRNLLTIKITIKNIKSSHLENSLKCLKWSQLVQNHLCETMPHMCETAHGELAGALIPVENGSGNVN
jgi:hypothetical protein